MFRRILMMLASLIMAGGVLMVAQPSAQAVCSEPDNCHGGFTWTEFTKFGDPSGPAGTFTKTEINAFCDCDGDYMYVTYTPDARIKETWSYNVTGHPNWSVEITYTEPYSGAIDHGLLYATWKGWYNPDKNGYNVPWS